MSTDLQTHTDASGCVTFIAPLPISGRARRRRMDRLVTRHGMSKDRAEQIVDDLTDDEIDAPTLPDFAWRR